MAGDASDIQIAGFLIALRVKGETVQELAGLARTMRALGGGRAAASTRTCSTPPGPAAAGTTFNVSTTAALIAAGAGCIVAKHGSRSATGLSGSADVLEALGARIDLEPAAIGRCIEEIGFGFMFAPYHHPATRHVVAVRKRVDGPNDLQLPRSADQPGRRQPPAARASPTCHTLPKMAGALALLGTHHALLVCSDDGLDELSISAATRVIEVIRTASYASTTSTPEELRLTRHPPDAVPGGDPAENAEITRRDLRRRAGRRAATWRC